MATNKLIKINKGDTIALTVMSSIVGDFNQVDSFVKMLQKEGYKVKCGECIYSKDGFLAGTDQKRANELMSFFLDDEIKGILCYKGGYGAQRILPYLDFKEIKKHPKLLMGFSDVTVLLNTLNQFANMPTVHGEMGVCMSEYDDFTYNHLFKVLSDGPTGELRNQQNEAICFKEGIVEAELVGGNLSLIYALMGTRYEIDLKDKILFIEDVDEAAYSIDRMLSSLILSGKMNQLKGLIGGYFTNCSSYKGVKVEEVLKRNLKDFNFPILLNFESGHSKPFINLPIGQIVKLDATNKVVTALESLYQQDK